MSAPAHAALATKLYTCSRSRICRLNEFVVIDVRPSLVTVAGHANAVGLVIVPMLHDGAWKVHVHAVAHDVSHVGHGLAANRKTQRLCPHHTSHKSICQFLPALLHAPPNENDAIFTCLVFAPFPCVVLMPHHVDALHDKHFVFTSNVEQALDTHEVFSNVRVIKILANEVLESGHTDDPFAANSNIGNRRIHLRLIHLHELIFFHVLLFQDPCKVEGTNIDQLAHVHFGVLTPDDFHHGVDLFDALLKTCEGIRTNQINLIEQNGAGECDLSTRCPLILSIVLVQLFKPIEGVNQSNYIVNFESCPTLVVQQERLNDRCRVSGSSEFDQHPIQLYLSRFLLLGDVVQSVHEVTTNCAANAAVVENSQLL
mmetsp:Transcript_44146/g.84771  ORF Transcript_44146/g.84771 Transcript_44146/m.84771 type:complete len:370 (+) Transcript_44146:123-1232(+)